jgi:1-deoxy-D-xylulose-5-phosphate synthase
LAAEGFRPVAAIYSTFAQRAYDQVFHDICLQKLPVTLALDRAGLVGDDGPTHHGVFDLSFLRHFPGMTVMAPKDENELQHMIKTAVYADIPIALRYPRGAGYGITLDHDPSELEIGKGEILTEGADLAIIAIGITVYPALHAAEKLAEHGINATVMNARFVKPLDREMILRIARRTGVLITVEENSLAGGFGSAVLELLESEGISGITVKRIGIPDRFIEHGSQAQLREDLGLDANGITDVATNLLSSRKRSPVSPFIRVV